VDGRDGWGCTAPHCPKFGTSHDHYTDPRTVRQRKWQARRDGDRHGYLLLFYALVAFLFWFGFVAGCGAALIVL
jgi:hypothetical protein